LEKGMQLLMVLVIILTILTFVVSIVIGHATDYSFIFGSVDTTNLTLSLLSNGKISL